MKVIGIVLKIIGGAIILAASILWAASDLSKPLWLIAITVIGAWVMYSSRITDWISSLWVRRLESVRSKKEQVNRAREQAERDQAKAAKAEAKKQAALEQAAVFDDIILSIATPKRIEKALRFLAENRPDLAEQLNDVLRQFDEAHKNIGKIKKFKTSNERFSGDVPAFEAALSDIATHSGAIINAVQLNTDVKKTIKKVIEENQITLGNVKRAMSAILNFANQKLTERKPDQSTAQLGVIETVYTNLSNEKEEVPKW